MENVNVLPPCETAETETENQIFVPIKFNKQILNLELGEAQELAQKGMKFDAISEDYNALRELARGDGKSVGEYIDYLKNDKLNRHKSNLLEKCGGDEELALHILQLEGNKGEELRGFSEVLEYFPNIKTLEDLPWEVLQNAELKGTLLVDEYLRYIHKQDALAKQSISFQKRVGLTATGNLKNKKGAQSPETAEFLRGLWQK